MGELYISYFVRAQDILGGCSFRTILERLLLLSWIASWWTLARSMPCLFNVCGWKRTIDEYAAGFEAGGDFRACCFVQQDCTRNEWRRDSVIPKMPEALWRAATFARTWRKYTYVAVSIGPGRRTSRTHETAEETRESVSIQRNSNNPSRLR